MADVIELPTRHDGAARVAAPGAATVDEWGRDDRFIQLVGPLLGAGVSHAFGLSAVFLTGAVLSLGAGLMSLLMPDLGSESRSAQREAGHASVWSVIARHRRVLLTLGVAVVVISAWSDARDDALAAGADRFVLKPFVPDDLRALVEELVP